MRVAFYAPMKPPDHPVASGDRRMARSLLQALEAGGHTTEVASPFRSYDRTGNLDRQLRLRRLGLRLAERLIRRLLQRPPDRRPDAWLSYHVYHKSPDHLGPRVSRALRIPYLIAEASIARKQAAGPFAPGFQDSVCAIEAAHVVLAMTTVDRQGLAGVVRPPWRLIDLPPFSDVTPFMMAAGERQRHRRAFAATYGLDPGQPWLLAVGMMRQDAKLCSYRRLAAALARLDRAFRMIVVGDGPARPDVEAAFADLRERTVFCGRLPIEGIAGAAAACDLFVWPAVREAYGLAMLEAGAAGLPVIAARTGGVEAVVQHGRTGLLVPPDDPDALANAVRELLDDPERRRRLAEAAARFVRAERSVDRASRTLDHALEMATAMQSAALTG